MRRQFSAQYSLARKQRQQRGKERLGYSVLHDQNTSPEIGWTKADGLYKAHLHALHMFEKLIQFIPEQSQPHLSHQHYLCGRRAGPDRVPSRPCCRGTVPVGLGASSATRASLAVLGCQPP